LSPAAPGLQKRSGIGVADLGPIAVLVGVAALLWLLSEGQSLRGDEWRYATRLSSQPLWETVFDPPSPGHLIVLPLLGYGALFEAFGIESYAPLRIAWISALLVCGWLFFALIRQRVGIPLALMAMTLLVLLGSSWEVVASPLRLPSLVAIAAGLGAILLLERRRPGADIAAAILLVASLLSHSTGLAFLAAAACLIWLRPESTRRGAAWVVVIPAIGYAAWWIGLRDAGEDPRLTELAQLPLFLAGSAASVVGSVTGPYSIAWLQGGPFEGPVSVTTVAIPALIVIGLLTWGLRERLRSTHPLPPTLLAAVVGLVVLWITTGIAPGPDRVPWASRYLFPAAVFFLWALAELARGVTLRRRGISIIAGVFAFALAANVAQLYRASGDAVDESKRVRAVLAALEIARGDVDPHFRPNDAEGRFLIGDLNIEELTAADYFRIADRYGTPAYDSAELAESPELRRVAETTLARIHRPG
jgi:hypothetical protein